MGDFDEMLIGKMGISHKHVIVCPVYDKRPLPQLNDINAIIVTGSHDMVTNKSDWSLYLENWIRHTALYNVPVLGICYAHQLMAQTFGGVVGYHPQGLEVGSSTINLTDEGKNDLLFSGLPICFPVYVAHSQTVIVIPKGASILAYSSFEPHHAVKFGNRMWGLQFHPEFTAEVMHVYIEQSKKALRKAGYDTMNLHNSVIDSPCGEILLKRFVEIAEA